MVAPPLAWSCARRRPHNRRSAGDGGAAAPTRTVRSGRLETTRPRARVRARRAPVRTYRFACGRRTRTPSRSASTRRRSPAPCAARDQSATASSKRASRARGPGTATSISRSRRAFPDPGAFQPKRHGPWRWSIRRRCLVDALLRRRLEDLVAYGCTSALHRDGTFAAAERLLPTDLASRHRAMPLADFRAANGTPAHCSRRHAVRTPDESALVDRARSDSAFSRVYNISTRALTRGVHRHFLSPGIAALGDGHNLDASTAAGARLLVRTLPGSASTLRRPPSPHALQDDSAALLAELPRASTPGCRREVLLIARRPHCRNWSSRKRGWHGAHRCVGRLPHQLRPPRRRRGRVLADFSGTVATPTTIHRVVFTGSTASSRRAARQHRAASPAALRDLSSESRPDRQRASARFTTHRSADYRAHPRCCSAHPRAAALHGQEGPHGRRSALHRPRRTRPSVRGPPASSQFSAFSARARRYPIRSAPTFLATGQFRRARARPHAASRASIARCRMAAHQAGLRDTRESVQVGDGRRHLALRREAPTATRSSLVRLSARDMRGAGALADARGPGRAATTEELVRIDRRRDG